MASALSPPSWLNEGYFLHALNASLIDLSQQSTILNFDVLPGLPAGQNYTSVIYKTNVRYRIKSDDVREQIFFVKTPIEDGGEILNVIRDGKFYETEILMYTECFPYMENLVGTLKMIPRHFPSKQDCTLLLEDLSREGYTMRDKLERLDFDHCRLVFEALAEFHAASVVLFKHKPHLVETVGEAVFCNKSPGSLCFIQEKFEDFCEVIRSWKGYERFVDVFLDYTETLWDRLGDIYKRRETLNVLNHGDAWTNNFLFKYGDDGIVDRVKLIDFQMPVFGSFAIDLHYVTWTSMQSSVREHRLGELHSLYLATLNQSLENFQCHERVSEEVFKKEIYFTQFFALFTMILPCNVIFSDLYLPSKVTFKSPRDYARHVNLQLFNCDFLKTNIEDGLRYLENNNFFKFSNKDKSALI